MAGPGTFYWNELLTHDAERAKAFYARTLGWTYDTMPMGEMGDYHVVRLGDAMVGGIMQIGGPDFENVPDNWFSYIEVDDLDERLALLAAEGGTVVRPPFDIEGVGTIAIVAIPGGAMQGWMVPARQG